MSDSTEDSSEASASSRPRSASDPDRAEGLLQAFSHDVATPLANLKLAADVVASAGGRLSEEKLADLGLNMSSEADRLGHMIDTLVQWAHFEAGKPQLRSRWLLAEDLINSALRVTGVLLDDHEVVVTIVPDMAYVRGDEARIETVLINLVDHALARTPSGDPIEIAARADDTGCTFEVIDTGPRLDSEDDVAGASSRTAGDSTRSGRVGALTGRLGLILSRKIIEAHDGEMSARNRKDESGAVFAFVLGYGGQTPPRAPIEAVFGDDGND